MTMKFGLTKVGASVPGVGRLEFKYSRVLVMGDRYTFFYTFRSSGNRFSMNSRDIINLKVVREL